MFGLRNKKEAGGIVSNGRQIGYTSQCVHCGSHEEIVLGSGKKRGWCKNKCGKSYPFICGRPLCMKYCIPYEVRLDYEEAINKSDFKEQLKIKSSYPMIDHVLLGYAIPNTPGQILH